MIKPPSVQNEYTLIYSGDPALNLPTDETERETVLRVAHETGRWDALLGSESPTLFHVRPLPGTVFDWLLGERIRGNLTDVETWTLALRLALRRVDNFGKHEVKTARNDDGHVLADVAIIDALYAEAGGLGRDIVAELGTAVIERATTALRPKS